MAAQSASKIEQIPQPKDDADGKALDEEVDRIQLGGRQGA
jgi:hypothetical protein